MDPAKTLWMGNIEKDMNESYIREIFNSLSKL